MSLYKATSMARAASAILAIAVYHQAVVAAAIATVPTPPKAFEAKGLRVLAYQRDPKTGVNVWTVQHQGSGAKTVLYSLPDNKFFFSGALWDGSTGANISDPFFAALESASPPVAAIASGESKRSVPASPSAVPGSIKRLAELSAIKDGDAPIHKTLFVFFDPRCPYCKQLYDVTRNASGLAGRAIRWIPVTVLGQKERGAALVADILQSKSPAEALKISFTGFGNAQVQPSKQTLAAISENEAIFWAAFQANPSAGRAAVPVAFFMDNTGHPQMVPNPGAVLQKIFTEMN